MGKAKHPAPRRNLAGFTLPLIAALLIVASLAATTFLLSHDRESMWKPQANTKTQLKDITTSLTKFQRAYHRLPCPAPHDQLPGSTSFGIEGTDCALGSAINGLERYDIGSGKFMRVGVLPVRTLGLPDSYNSDEYGNRFTYVVIEALTDPYQFTDETGSLKLDTDSGTTTTDGAFAVIAHGKDSKGAYSLKAATMGTSCSSDSTSSSDAVGGQHTNSSPGIKNCSYGSNQGKFFAYSSSLQKNTNYFDDQVVVASVDTQAKGINLPCVAPSTPTPVAWSDSSDSLASCSAPFANMTNGETRNLTNTNAHNSGSAQVRCNNGTVEIVSSSCTHTPACPASSLDVTWNGTGADCSAPRGDMEDGQSITLTNTMSGRTGSVKVTCNGGVVTPSNVSCTGNSCSLPSSLGGGSLAHNATINAFSTSSVACGTACSSETRTCSYGTLSGSYTNQSCSAASCANCTLDGVTVAHNSPITAYAASSVGCGSSCASEQRICTNGVLSGSYPSSSCAVQACASCTFNGVTVEHGGSIAGFENATVACGSTCNSQTRTCTNGVLSGSYANASCAATCTNSCTTPWGDTVVHGDSVTAYASDSVVCSSSGGGCVSETRTCTNGMLSGSYTKKTCAVSNCTSGFCWTNIGSSTGWPSVCHNVVPCPSTNMDTACLNGCNSGAVGAGDCCEETPNKLTSRYFRCLDHGDGSNAACTTPWGTTVVHGDYVSAYSSSNASCGTTCSAIRESRVCNNGVLSGSYTNQSCTEATSCSGTSCSLPWGGTLASGSNVTAYSSTNVACGSTCASVSQTRTCTNGVLSGSYTNQSCSVAACPASCSLPWGGTLTSGSSVTAYSSSSVACGSTCASVSQTRTCTNGVLSGSYTNQSCSVASCSGVWERTGIVNYGNLGNGLPAPASTCTLSSINTNTDVNGWPTGGGACSPIGSTCLYRLAQSPQLVRVGYYECKTGSTSSASSCTTPWGTTIVDGASVTAYSATSSSDCSTSCSSMSATRTCHNGTLSGNSAFRYQSCADATCAGTWQYSGGGSCSASACPNSYLGPPSGPCATIGESCGIPRSDAFCGDSGGAVMEVYICQ